MLKLKNHVQLSLFKVGVLLGIICCGTRCFANCYQIMFGHYSLMHFLKEFVHPMTIGNNRLDIAILHSWRGRNVFVDSRF